MKDVIVDPRYLTYKTAEVQEILDGVKEVDETPKAGSPYPVSSGGMHSMMAGYTTTEQLAVLLDGKQDTVTVADETGVRSIVTDYEEE